MTNLEDYLLGQILCEAEISFFSAPFLKSITLKVVCHSNLRKVVKTSLLRNDARALCDDCVAARSAPHKDCSHSWPKSIYIDIHLTINIIGTQIYKNLKPSSIIPIIPYLYGTNLKVQVWALWKMSKLKNRFLKSLSI